MSALEVIITDSLFHKFCEWGKKIAKVSELSLSSSASKKPILILKEL